MKQVPVAELIPGMVTAEDIIGYDSNIIIPKGVILTENIISRLDSYSIYYVQIIDDIVDELSKPMSAASLINDNMISNPSSKEKVRNSEQFKNFSQDFIKCADHFKNNLMQSLYKNEPLCFCK